jgi:hypothetical protein
MATLRGVTQELVVSVRASVQNRHCLNSGGGSLAGSRIRLSALGIERCHRLKSHTGIISIYPSGTSFRILIDGRKLPVTLHQSYVQPDEERRPSVAASDERASAGRDTTDDQPSSGKDQDFEHGPDLEFSGEALVF